MNLEIIYKDNTTSKLTIAKDRVTIKIKSSDKVYENRIINFSKQIVGELIPVDYTFRGQFNLYENKFGITMSNFEGSKVFREELNL